MYFPFWARLSRLNTRINWKENKSRENRHENEESHTFWYDSSLRYSISVFITSMMILAPSTNPLANASRSAMPYISLVHSVNFSRISFSSSFSCVHRWEKSPRPAKLSSGSAQIEQWDRPDWAVPPLRLNIDRTNLWSPLWTLDMPTNAIFDTGCIGLQSCIEMQPKKCMQPTDKLEFVDYIGVPTSIKLPG